MRQEMMGFRDAMASAGPYANNLRVTPDRKPDQYLLSDFLLAVCSSWHPTNLLLKRLKIFFRTLMTDEKLHAYYS